MTIFRRKNMASLFSALRHNISIKRSPSKTPAASRSSTAVRCCIPRQKKVLDFNAYFADQLEDDDDDEMMMRADDLAGRGEEEEEGEEDQERGESSFDEDDEADDDNHSVIIDTDDSGTIVMTVVHRCHCGRQQCQDGVSGESEAGRNRTLGCQEQACAGRREGSDENCVDFCSQQLDSLRLARS